MDHHFGGEKQQAEALWETIIRATPQGFWPAETELLASRGKMAD
jgi:hypothetical protein